MQLRAVVAVVFVSASFVVTACDESSPDNGGSGDGGSCGEGYFYYTDKQCGVPHPESSEESTCAEAGDLKCHKRCLSDADCADENDKHCVLQGLNSGGDFICNDTVRICLSNTKVYPCE